MGQPYAYPNADGAFTRADILGARITPHRRPARITAGHPGQGLPDASSWRSVPRRAASGRVRHWPHPGVLRVVDGVPDRVDADRLRALGNAVVPQVAEWIGCRIIDAQERTA